MVGTIRIFLLLIACFLTFSKAHGQLYSFQNFNHKSGLNFGTINVVEQSENGAIYLGTDGGELILFDGYNFSELEIDKKNNTHHFASIQAIDNHLYFTSKYKGFFKYDVVRNKLHPIDIRRNHGAPLHIFHFNKYNYIFRSNGIYREQNGEIKLIRDLNSNPISETFQSFVTDNFCLLSTDVGNFIIYQDDVLTFEEFLGNSNLNLTDLRFGYFLENQLILYNSNFSHELSITFDGNSNLLGFNEKYIDSPLDVDDELISASYGKYTKDFGVLTKKGRLFHLREGHLVPIIHNFNEPLISPQGIFTDRFGDYWISSGIKGLYKVSLEAFTKIQLNPVYLNPDIGLSYKTALNDVIVSLHSNRTYVGNISMDLPFKEFEFRIYSCSEIEEILYAGTSEGLKILQNGPNPFFKNYLFDGQRVNFVFHTQDNRELWVHVFNEGLYVIKNGGAPQKLSYKSLKLPDHFYTAQESVDGKTILFGTNDGILAYNRTQGTFKRISQKLGNFCANSCRDIYGTCWFTLDNGILGYTKSEKTIELKGSNVFRSNLFYTLTTDTYGNLIIGTNKGIDLIKVDSKGSIIGHRIFDKNSGFLGFETHMRSSFTSDGISYLGTVDGLFSVNTSIIEETKIPLKPWVAFVDVQNGVVKNSSVHLKMGVYNSKFGIAKFQYRIVGLDNKWKEIVNPESLVIDGLSDGNYIVEIRASYDGILFSEVSQFKFEVDLPIWKSNWFIILVLVVAIGFNILLIQQNKHYKSTVIIESKESLVSTTMTPAVILFAAISVSVSHSLAPFLDDSLELHIGSTLIVAFTLFLLFFVSIHAKRKNDSRMNQILLMITLYIVSLHFYYEIYLSHLHPFHIIGVVLTSSVSPYVLPKLRLSITYALTLLFLSTVCISVLGDTIYPKAYFLIAVIVMICLIIINSYLRFDSIEKLSFVSGILNRGNFPAVAFDKNGSIIYASENIGRFMDIDSESLVNKKITTLNHFVPFEGAFKDADIMTEFKDGDKYVVPMRSPSNQIQWLEWTYNVFSKDVFVITGNDITEKIELENTYELLVQNAEDFIYRCDLDGNFLFLNDPCFEKLGYSKEELIHTNSMKLAKNEYKMDLIRYYKRHFENKLKTSYKEFPILTKDGKEIWVAQYMTTVYHPGSDIPSGYIALARDITERRKSDEIIRLQSESITDSINYAHKIQQRLLPHPRKFKSNFQDFFIFYQPKDIVSGDFYWYEKLDGKHYIVLADCTGHGVPGAFMTLLGTNMLNTIILENNQRDPGMILTVLHKRLTALLPKGDDQGHDGMEMVICAFDDFNNELAFACAGARFFIYNEGQITMLKGDPNHIGDIPPEGFVSYRTHFTDFNPGDQLIMFTDGFHDQFGGPKDKRFFFRNFVELIEDNAHLPMIEQKKIISSKFQEWKGQEEQTDDVTIVSLKKIKANHD